MPMLNELIQFTKTFRGFKGIYRSIVPGKQMEILFIFFKCPFPVPSFSPLPLYCKLYSRRTLQEVGLCSVQFTKAGEMSKAEILKSGT